MAQRARYIGPDDECAVYDPNDVYAPPMYVVERNKFLPSDAPQKLHRELGAMDHWTLEDAPDTKGASTQKDEG